MNSTEDSEIREFTTLPERPDVLMEPTPQDGWIR